MPVRPLHSFTFKGCQLARNYDPMSRLPFPVLVEPKIDGGRLIIGVTGRKAEGFSRRGHPKPGLEPILKPLSAVDGWVFDSEAWMNSWNDTMTVFNTISPNAKKIRKLGVYLFDIIPVSSYIRKMWAVDQRQRKALLKDAITKLGGMCLKTDLENGKIQLEALGPRIRNRNLIYVDYIEAHNHRDIRDAYLIFRKNGYEGAMIKADSAGYMLDRVGAWRKVKPFKYIEGTITRCIEGEGKHHGRLGSFRVNLGSNSECGLGSGFDDKTREHFWSIKKDLIGRRVKFKVQDDETQVSEARNPIFVALLEKDES
jgi:ATP-dependent DNA ligase